MTRFSMVRSGFAIAAIVSLIGFAPMAAANAPAAHPASSAASAALLAAVATEDDQAAAVRFASCLVSQRPADLILLMDESTSIGNTDPTGARMTAANYMLTSLSNYVQQNRAVLNVSVAGFGANYNQRQDWTPLNGDSLGGLQATVDAEKNHINNTDGFETDYYMALNGARVKLDKQVSDAGGADRCQAIAWFTDGKLDIRPRLRSDDQDRQGTSKPYTDIDLTVGPDAPMPAVIAAAQAGICAPGGLIDGIRGSGIITFAVGLVGPAATEADFDLLKSIADGTSAQPGGGACGSLVNGTTPGLFLSAKDIDSLINAFDQIPPPIQLNNEICQKDFCDNFRHQFVLDDSIDLVGVLASADADNVDVYLTSPGSNQHYKLSERTVAQPTSMSVDATTVTYTWLSARTVSFTINKSAANTTWAGLWYVTFVDPTEKSAGDKSHVNLHISADLLPTVATPNPLQLDVGSVDAVTFGLEKADKTVVPVSSIAGTITYSASLSTGGGAPIALADNLGKDQLADPVSVDLSKVLVPGPATLTLTLLLTTANYTAPDGSVAPGTTLLPREIELPVSLVQPPPNPNPGPDQPPVPHYPTIERSLNFGSFEGTGPVTADLNVTGPGCVYVASPDLQLIGHPQGSGEITVTSKDTVCPGDGAQQKMTFTLSTAGVGTGTLNGSLNVMVSADGNPAGAPPVAIPIKFTASMTKPLNTTNFVWTLIAALILGPGIPLMLLYLAKWLTATIPKRSLAALTAAVSVAHGTVLRGGNPFMLQRGDLSQLINPEQAGRRRLQINEMTLRTRTGISPARAGYVQVTSGAMVGAGSTEPESTGKRMSARLPLAVHNTWAVLHDLNGPENEATVLLIVTGNSSDDVIQANVDDMVARLPTVLANLRDRARNAGLGPRDGHRAATSATDLQPAGFGGPPSNYGDQSGFGGPPAGPGAPAGFGAPPEYGRPPGFGGPPDPGFGGPQNPGFGGQQNPGFGGQQNPRYGAPDTPGFGYGEPERPPGSWPPR